MERIRLGYIGCGFMAQRVHIPNFSSLPGCELVALAELRPELGRKVQARYGIERLYHDHQQLLADPSIQAVAISAAYSVQAELAREALEAGKDVFMEKPMAVSVAQADSLLAAVAASGHRLMVGYMKRYDAGNALVKATLDEFRRSGELGDITFARNHGFGGNWTAGVNTPLETTDEPMPPAPVRRPDWLPAEFLQPYIAYLQQFTHNVNLLRFLLDANDDVTVRAVDLDPDGYTGVVLFNMAGTRAVLETGRLSHFRWDEHTQVYLRDGWVKTWAPPLLLRQVPAEVEVYKAGSVQTFTRPIPEPHWSWSYMREAEHYICSLQSNQPFRSSAEDTRTDVRLFEEIYREHLRQRGVV